jgi:DNA primase
VDAVEKLAGRLGMTVPRDAQETAKVKAKLNSTSVLNKVAEFYSSQLKNHPSAKMAVDYLKKRGLTGVVAKNFAIGFAPPGWDNLLNHFQGQPDALKILEETGLIIKHPQQHFYDRFRERVMFPIRDRKGEVIGFGARVLDKSQPKYLNSPESPIFQKGYCLYGLYEALQNRDKWQSAIVVEGYMDVVALAQFEVHGTFATSGTAITSHHLSQLFHLVPEVVFCFDGDKAGQAAAWKALQLALPLLTESRQVRFVFLPQGEDPDTYVRQYGNVAFRDLQKNAMPLSEYFFATLSQKVKPDSVDNRAHFATLAREMLEQIPAGIFKEMMYEQLAQIVASTPQVVRGEKAYRSFYPYKKTPFVKSTPPPQPMEPIYVACALLLRSPSLFELIKEKFPIWHEMQTPGIELFQALWDLLTKNPNALTAELRQKLQEDGLFSQRLLECENKVALIPDEGLEAEFSGAILRLEVIGREQITERLIQKAKSTHLTDEEKQKLKEFLQSRESI